MVDTDRESQRVSRSVPRRRVAHLLERRGQANAVMWQYVQDGPRVGHVPYRDQVMGLLDGHARVQFVESQ